MLPVEARVRTTVAELRPGAEVDGPFACTRKERLTARNGSAYLALELRDRSGTITARAFREADFLAAAYRDLDELDGFLEHLAREVYDPDYRRLLDSFLNDDGFRAELRLAPCTRGGHHAYLGGLLEHTVAVGTLAQETCVLHPRLN